MTHEKWLRVPWPIRNAIRDRFPRHSVQEITELDYAFCAVGLPYVKTIKFEPVEDQ